MTIKWVGSPFYSAGRPQRVSKIVLHWMNGTLAGTDQMFKTAGVSAHYGIENSTVHQYVDEKNQAWHAISANPFSIGIEHSAAPGRAATKTTLETSAKLCAEICKRYKLNPLRDITVHNQYVATRCPGTNHAGTVLEKGGLDVNHIRKRASEIMKGVQVIGNENHVKILFRQFVNREPTAAELRDYKAKDVAYALNKLHPARTDLPKTVKQLKETQTALKQATAALDAAQKQAAMSEELKQQVAAAQKEVEKQLKRVAELEATQKKRDENVQTIWDAIGDLVNKLLRR